jgi:clan AA aspartic protease
LLGTVSADGRKPVLPLTLLPLGASAQQGIEIEAVVDTGFDGELTLPRGLVRRLGYPYVGFTRGTLANGSTVRFDYHEGLLLWHGGEERAVVVLAAGEAGNPLVGMTLLRGSRLTIDAVPGGAVRVERPPG